MGETGDVLFGRSAFGGFNRRDVMDYIDKLQRDAAAKSGDPDLRAQIERELDALERRMTAEIYQKHNVALTGISIYSVDLSDPETDTLFHQVHDEVMADENILQIHGFMLNKKTSTAVFDLVVSFDVDDRRALIDQITKKLSEQHPKYYFIVNQDNDISD